jgi:hypothetical protein
VTGLATEMLAVLPMFTEIRNELYVYNAEW